MMALLLMLLTLALSIGVTCFAAEKMAKAKKTGKIFFGPEGSLDWHDIGREHEPFRFWEAMSMYAMLGALGFGGTGWTLLRIPGLMGELM
ncbi:MAG: hypothetical protein ABGZ35_13130 [Planctomycetaceae bacterium]